MATLDVLTIEDARTAVGYSAGDSSLDARLGSMVTGLSLTFDRLCGPVVQRSVTARLDGGHSWVLLRLRPLSAITSVTEYSLGVGTVLTAETLTVAGDYRAELRETDGLMSGYLFRRSQFADSRWVCGQGNVVVVGTAGRFATTAAANGSVIAEAARMALKAMWRSELNGTANFGDYEVPSASFPTSAVPKVALDMLAGELLKVHHR